jgi:hypothetical protein
VCAVGGGRGVAGVQSVAMIGDVANRGWIDVRFHRLHRSQVGSLLVAVLVAVLALVVWSDSRSSGLKLPAGDGAIGVRLQSSSSGVLGVGASSQPIANQRVLILHAGHVVGRVRTDADGDLRVTLRPGVYGLQLAQYRVGDGPAWSLRVHPDRVSTHSFTEQAL